MSPPRVSPAPSPAASERPAPLDLTDVVARAPFAFRVHDGRARVDRANYRVSDEADGVAFSAVREADESTRRDEATLHLRTASMTRGHRSIGRGSLATIDANGDRIVDRGSVVERFRADEAGVEQTWTFATKPAGEGDVVVEVRASGLELVATNDSGLHFASESGLGVRYGHATFVDADGRRTSVPVADRDSIRMRIPADAIDGARYPAVLDPIIGPEFGIDEPVAVPSNAIATAPTSAFGGGVYLVVWAETQDVYAVRVSTGGVVQDAAAFVVTNAAYDQATPRVAFDGTNFVVVWSDRRSNTSWDVYGARVSTAGAVLDANGIAITTAASDQVAPDVAFGGGGLFVVWEDRSAANPDLYGARMTTAGVVTDVTALPIVTSASKSTVPRLEFDGTNFLVAFLDETASTTDVAACRVSTAGLPLDGDGIRLTTDATSDQAPLVAWNGTDYLIAWTRAGTGTDVVHTRVATDGTLVDAAPVTTAGDVNDQSLVDVASDGDGFLVLYRSPSESDSVRAIRVAPGSAVSPAGGIGLAASTWIEGTLASNGTDYFVVYSSTATSPVQYVGTRLDATNALLDTPRVLVSKQWNSTSTTAVASDGTQFLVVYNDSRDGGDVYAVRVSATGTVLDPVGIPVAIGAGGRYVRNVAFDGMSFQVAVAGSSNLYTYRVSPAGVVTGPDTTLDSGSLPALSPASPSGAGMASNRTNTLVTTDAYWSNFGFPERRLDVRTVSRAGVKSSAETLATNEGLPDPAIATNGTDYLVVYHSGGDIRARRVSGAGGNVGNVITVSAAASSQADPAVAFDGTNYVVAWADRRNTTYSEIYAARVSSAGTVLDAAGVRIAGVATADRYAPTLARVGNGVYLTWKDYRNTSTALFGARLDASLMSLDGTGVELQHDTEGWGPASVAFASGRAMIVYGLPDPNAAKRMHTFGRIVCVGTSDATCDGIDDDCDGTSDEDFTPYYSSCGMGECSASGTVTCSNGHPVDSCVAGTPTTDNDCDGWDDDCDGTPDDAYGTVQSSCGLGVCTSSGTRTCENWGIVDSCVPGAPTGSDTNCNAVDEDCDGHTDDGFSGVVMSCGPGICATAGLTRCSSGTVVLVCTPPPGAPRDDDCDGFDDDCDQVPDDDFAQAAPRCGIGACVRTGTIACVAGSVKTTACVPGAPIGPDTTCDGIDDDCDGAVDDDTHCASDASVGDGGTATPPDAGCACTTAGAPGAPLAPTFALLAMLAIVRAAMLMRRRGMDRDRSRR